MVKIEINLSNLAKFAKAKKRVWVKPTAKRKGHYRMQEVGQKEIENKPTKEYILKPDSEIKSALQIMVTKERDETISDDGIFHIDTKYEKDFKGNLIKESRNVALQLQGNELVNLENGDRVALSSAESIKRLINGPYFHLWNLYKFIIPGEVDRLMGGVLDYKIDDEGRNEYDTSMVEIDSGVIDTYIPEYEDATEDGEGKYKKSTKLRYPTNCPIHTSSNAVNAWYAGDKTDILLPIQAMKDIKSGDFNGDNILHPGLAVAIRASEVVAKNHGSEYIYRGETNTELAKELISSVIEDGVIELPDKIGSWTENDRLAKWYAAVHKQNAPSSGTQTKTNIVLRLNKDRYLPNVILDYRVTGEKYRPEEEMTILQRNIKLKPEDIFVYTIPKGKKRKSWVSLGKFLSDGGTKEELYKNISKGSPFRR